MKYFFFIAILVGMNTYAQTNLVLGTYVLKLEARNALIVDTLLLKADGTFTFHEYDWHENGIPPERNKYSKGKWRFEKNIVYFLADELDIGEKHTLNFNNTEARFSTKSLRDKSNKEFPKSLKFYKSNIFWMVKRNLIKK